MKCKECKFFDKGKFRCKEDAEIKNDKYGFDCNYDDIIKNKIKYELREIPILLFNKKNVDYVNCDFDENELCLNFIIGFKNGEFINYDANFDDEDIFEFIKNIKNFYKSFDKELTFKKLWTIGE